MSIRNLFNNTARTSPDERLEHVTRQLDLILRNQVRIETRLVRLMMAQGLDHQGNAQIPSGGKCVGSTA